MSPQNRRSSSRDKPSAALFTDAKQKADLEARNGLLQFDEVLRLAADSISSGKFSLTSQTVKDLQRLAIHDIYRCAGQFRTEKIEISNTAHKPPPPEDVPDLVEAMCEYASKSAKSAVHVSSYLMWRQNWIHPFFGGNGRTSRAISYLALCVRLGFVLVRSDREAVGRTEIDGPVILMPGTGRQ